MTVMFRVLVRRREYFLPAALILKCFVDCSDRVLFERIVLGDSDPLMADRAVQIIRESRVRRLASSDSLLFANSVAVVVGRRRVQSRQCVSVCRPHISFVAQSAEQRE